MPPSNSLRLCCRLLLLSSPVLVSAANHARAEHGPAIPRAQRVLVLKNGRVVHGRISQCATGYLVDKPNGSLVVPVNRVQLEADSLQHAYRKLRSQVPTKSAEQHLVLARWCLTNALYRQCEAELRSALSIDPDLNEARSTLKRLEETVHRDNPRHLQRSMPRARTPDGFEPTPVQSLAGLSRETAGRYVRKVQPILLSRCGNAGCHGPTARAFRLRHVHLGRGAHRLSTEQNLAQVLRQIDPRSPEQSPLIVVPTGGHGGAGRPIFDGPAGSEQQALVREWVARVADELSQQLERRSDTPSLLAKTAGEPGRYAERAGDENPALHIGAGAAQVADVRDGETARADATVENAAGIERFTYRARSSTGTTTRDTLLNQILRQERPDAFDPAEFNRMMHGQRSNRR